MIRLMDEASRVTVFIDSWSGVTGSERANYQLFITGLCDLLGLATPEPAHEDARDDADAFERGVTFAHGDGSASNGYIDCYQRGVFAPEAKKVKSGVHTKVSTTLCCAPGPKPRVTPAHFRPPKAGHRSSWSSTWAK